MTISAEELTAEPDRPSVSDAPVSGQPRLGRFGGPFSVIAKVIGFLLILVAGYYAALDGLTLRHEIFERTPEIRFYGDVSNGFRWGRIAMSRGEELAKVRDGTPLSWKQFFDGYVATYREEEANPEGLDYPPLRLLVMALWVRHVHTIDPHRDAYQDGDPHIVAPLLMMNTISIGVAAVGMFFLVWVWMARQEKVLGAGCWVLSKEKVRTAESVLSSPRHSALSTQHLLCSILHFLLPVLLTIWLWKQIRLALPLATGPGWGMVLVWTAAFALVVALVRRWPAPYRFWGCGLLAAIMVWVDPTTLVNAYIWVQWDCWLLPAFVLAALLASLDCWFWAGVVIAIGACTKGQLLLAAPVIILWPLLGLRLRAAMSALAGVAATSACVLWPWLLAGPLANRFMMTLAIAVAVMTAWAVFFPIPIVVNSTVLARLRSTSRRISWAFTSEIWAAAFVVAVSAAFALTFWPLDQHTVDAQRIRLALLAAVVVLPPLVIRKRSLPIWAALVLGLGVFVAGDILNGDWSWYRVGYEFGALRDRGMALGPVPNIPTLLGERFDFDGPNDHVGPYNLPIFGRIDELRQLLFAVYVVLLVVCSAAAAVQARRRNTRMLVAIVTPWLLFTLLLPQMSARYGLWPSALSAAFIAVSTGATLLHLLFAAAALGILGLRLLTSMHASDYPATIRFIRGFHPDMAWLLIAMAIVWMCLAVSAGVRKKRNYEPPINTENR